MKKFAAVLAFSTVLALGATAKAADMVPPAAYDWTGVYVGGNIGYAFSGQDDVGIAVSNGNFIDSDTLQLSGIFGGAQIGADWQASSAVFGVLADIEAADIKDDFNGVVSDGVTTDAKSEIDVFGTVRGRLGWAFDRVLIYGTGGLAWANVNYKVTSVDDGGNSVKMSDDSTRLGYAVGAGLAWAIDDSWSVNVEYLYVNLGKDSVKGKVVDEEGELNGVTTKTEETPDFQSVKVGVNFKF